MKNTCGYVSDKKVTCGDTVWIFKFQCRNRDLNTCYNFEKATKIMKFRVLTQSKSSFSLDLFINYEENCMQEIAKTGNFGQFSEFSTFLAIK